jgi:hypothetical protein
MGNNFRVDNFTRMGLLVKQEPVSEGEDQLDIFCSHAVCLLSLGGYLLV